MELAERFRTAVAETYDTVASAELVPMVLARACVAVLPVSGAGLSLTDELRVPLGASDHYAVRAERLQTTLGEGPCLFATRVSRPVAVDQETMADRWPTFHRHLVNQTPYRSAASVPLLSRGRGVHLGALDLYLTIAEPVPDFFLTQVASGVAEPIAHVLFDRQPNVPAESSILPPWLGSSPVRDRMRVWVAVGILIERTTVSETDALAALRAYALTHDATLDEVADRLVARTLEPGDMFG